MWSDVQKEINSRLQQNIEAEKKAAEEKLKRELGALKEQLQVVCTLLHYWIVGTYDCRSSLYP